MSDENNPQAPLADHDPLRRAEIENASLRARLAQMEQANVVNGRFAGEAPKYLLNEPCFLDNTFIDRGTVIEFIDEPNMSMVPMNEPARRAMEAHIERLETGARRKAHMAGRDYYGLVTDRNIIIDTARQDMMQEVAQAAVPVIQMPVPHGTVPAMPHTPEAAAAARRGKPGKPSKMAVVAEPVQQGRPGADMGAPMLGPFDQNGPQGPAVVGRMVSQ